MLRSIDFLTAKHCLIIGHSNQIGQHAGQYIVPTYATLNKINEIC
ncbi:hypothetical protein XBJ1_3585 [Xenorhabdus bovienii SS-2004]|uniref:Uncharacterized protein n=1 Tax=Xenorhabdus bovienii (strain SS-2004) TaxID=406818 RepID=D3V4X4_XENBS|nr:hypothetical protein XBJ1_3585 [Xenorhabdus bovienii SS-2004]